MYRISHRVYASLKEEPENFILRKLKKNDGFYDPDTEEIHIDYRGEILPTLIHECLHKWFPDRSEKWVYGQESSIVNNLTTKQAVNLLRVLLNTIR